MNINSKRISEEEDKFERDPNEDIGQLDKKESIDDESAWISSKRRQCRRQENRQAIDSGQKERVIYKCRAEFAEAFNEQLRRQRRRRFKLIILLIII